MVVVVAYRETKQTPASDSEKLNEFIVEEMNDMATISITC